MSENATITLAQAALDYAQRGWNIFPVTPRGKEPLVSQLRANHDADTIAAWWDQWPDANIGLLAGSRSGIYILDIDGAEGEQSWAELMSIHAADTPETAEAATGRGRHLFYACEEKLPNSASKLGRKIDTRGEGGYVVLPPSVHESGRLYSWTRPPWQYIELPPLPPWVIEALTHKNGGPPTGEVPEIIEEGSRNETLFKVAARLRRDGLSAEEIHSTLAALNQTRCKPPLGKDEVRQIAEGAAKYEPANNLVVVAAPAGSFRLTDIGNAERLVSMHGANIRHSGALGWLCWDGRRWYPDATNQIMQHAKTTVRSIYAEAAAAPDEERREATAKHAVKSENITRLQAMVTLARSEVGVPVTSDLLDADDWLLSTLSGTINLENGEVHPNKRGDLITKLAPVVYDPRATCPRWLAFLDRIMAGNQDVIGFMQRAIGYALTGSVREQCIFILYGSGANGKTTFLETIFALLGDYATKMRAATLMVKRNETIPADVARLKGARFVYASEAEENQRLAEAFVKEMTGQESITARFLYKDEFTFMPTFKVFLSTNHKPVIKSTDYAMWRRIRMIPFTVTIPEAEQDRELADKLRAELPGILNWAVEGCLAWYKNGLQPPDDVLAATRQYREEMDGLAAFFNDRCCFGATYAVTGPLLYDSYKLWCENSAEQPIAAQVFGRKIGERAGITKRRGAHGVVVYNGIGLKIDPTGTKEARS